ncbi:WYL domain-containing protein [Actinosynnema sp. NPDC020468]|uniref:helix-turn-helix transcriptional regulator n=1 Tax=Actinosynnema sp. NPDC020468 TaxID=3154488 RepID=UPI0033CE2EBA
MRADRLVAVLLLMQARGRVTAAELAAELEVSVATARRDLEALSSAGVPVYPQPGRGGGWRLVGRARTDLTGLSSVEAQALFLLVGPAAAVSGEARAALRKLVGALPEPFRRDAESAAGAVVVDPARWGHDGPQRPELGVLQGAVVRRARVRLGYEGRRGRSSRVVEPWGLVEKDGVWYLLAGTAQGRRTFRVDRVVEVVEEGGVFERPAGFDLAVAWEEVVGVVEARRSTSWVTVVVAARFVEVLGHRFGRHFAVVDAVEARVRVGAPTPLDLARELAGWGGLVRVVGEDGAGVRVELGRIGRELAGLYG